MGAGGGGYDSYSNDGGNFPGANGDGNYMHDFDNVQVKQEPSDAGYPAQMPMSGALQPPPPPPPEDGEDGNQ